jgi:hypothetical protein
MATSPYFNNYNSKYSEQRLVEDIIVESIKIMGFDGFYLPNDNDQARDLLYGEDPVKKFQSAFPVEMYMSNVLNYSGEHEFFSKFGLEIKDNMEVIMSRRSFERRVPQHTMNRPREGDLIYIPFGNGQGELMEIKFVEQNKEMMMLGRKNPYFYELQLEKFRYSQEVIATGQPDIDIVIQDDAYAIDLTLGAGSGDYAVGEIVYQSADTTSANASCSATVKSWDTTTNTLAITNILGTFTDTQAVIGETSGANYILTIYDPMAVNVKNENYDNKLIQTSANGIIDFSETNPFGII